MIIYSQSELGTLISKEMFFPFLRFNVGKPSDLAPRKGLIRLRVNILSYSIY